MKKDVEKFLKDDVIPDEDSIIIKKEEGISDVEDSATPMEAMKSQKKSGGFWVPLKYLNTTF